jgi:hypothetical protein
MQDIYQSKISDVLHAIIFDVMLSAVVVYMAARLFDDLFATNIAIMIA